MDAPANEGLHGLELWKSDGTATGTVLVKDINAGPATSFPVNSTNVNGTLFFACVDGTSGDHFHLWKSDGTTIGTVKLTDADLGNRYPWPELTNVNGTLFFRANGGGGDALWKSDDTVAGTVMVKDIYPGFASGDPRYFSNVKGTLFFRAQGPNAVLALTAESK